MGYSQGYHGVFSYETREDREAAAAAADAYLRRESSIWLGMLLEQSQTEKTVAISVEMDGPAYLAYQIEAALVLLAEQAVGGCVECFFGDDDETAVCAGDQR